MTRTILALGLTLALIGGCTVPSSPSAGLDPVTGFPYGVYAKELRLPDVGHVSIHWIFGPDGRYAEVPFALDGQTLMTGVIRGIYTVDGDAVTIDTDYPSFIGTSVHTWRLDGRELWTTLVSSELPGDAEWFADVDRQPWLPIP